MIYPLVDYKKWALKYNLNIESNYCRNCGKLITPTIPHADGNYRGLKSKHHGCPPGFDHHVFNSVSAELKENIKHLTKLFKDI